MRLVWICVFTVPLFAQMRVGSAMAIRGPQPAARRPAPAPYRGTGYWGWGLGYGTTVVVQTAPEVQAPILVSSPLYQADRAQPAMREYGSVAPEPTAIQVTLVAFRDGHVESVREARQALARKPSASPEHLREAAKDPALAQQAAEALRRTKTQPR